MAWTSPRTWVAAETVTAALLNQHLRDQLKAIGDAWTAYTPAWTGAGSNPAIGNGTLTGSYMQAGKLVHARISVAAGSSTTYGSGTYSLSLPVAANATGVGILTIGTGGISDTGTQLYFRYALLTTSTTVTLRTEGNVPWAPTVPFTFGNTDACYVSVTYEAA